MIISTTIIIGLFVLLWFSCIASARNVEEKAYLPPASSLSVVATGLMVAWGIVLLLGLLGFIIQSAWEWYNV